MGCFTGMKYRGENMRSPEQLTEYLRLVSALETSIYNQERICKGGKETLAERKSFLYSGEYPRTRLPVPEKKQMQHQKLPYIIFWTVIVLGCLVECILVWRKAPLSSVLSVGFAVLVILFTGLIVKTETDYRRTYRDLVEKYRDHLPGSGGAPGHPRMPHIRTGKGGQKKASPEETETATRLRSALSEMNDALHHSKRLLAGLYDRDLIPPKYRNPVVMTTIYEYFSAGRVSSLTGEKGAFRLYETELRQNIISDNLHEISRDPERIRAHQPMLYSALETGNRTLRNITSGTGHGAGIAEDAELLAGITAYVAGLPRESAAAWADLK